MTLPSVAIVGRPNVGKSALFNRLVGRNIAIVHDQPGITRDRISGVCRRGHRAFTVWDTGGIVGAGESELTDDVRRAVQGAITVSDVLLFVVDAKDGLSPVDEELARMLRRAHKPVLLLVNKIDDDKHEALALEFDQLGFGDSISISAAHGRGMNVLVGAIDTVLPAGKANGDTHEPATGRPLTIAIVGRPNVGKSSLINAIISDERAIVSELAGTTRDAVDIVFERGSERFVFIDTAGIRRRGAHSSSVEVFSVMRAERSIRRADLCVLIVDLTAGVTAQDKRIAGMIQKAGRPCIVLLNKWDLVKPKRNAGESIRELVDRTRGDIFFLDYAPALVASAKTRENVDRLFRLIEKLRTAAKKRIGTGVLNRLLRAAVAANPPPMVSGKRLKLFYATQGGGSEEEEIEGEGPETAELIPPSGRSRPSASPRRGERTPSPLPPAKFVLFVNEPRLLGDTYRRYLEAQIRKAEPYTGLPVVLSLRRRVQKS